MSSIDERAGEMMIRSVPSRGYIYPFLQAIAARVSRTTRRFASVLFAQSWTVSAWKLVAAFMLTSTSHGSTRPNLSYAQRHHACKTSTTIIPLYAIIIKVVAGAACSISSLSIRDSACEYGRGTLLKNCPGFILTTFRPPMFRLSLM